mgnify:CR=1 FL=1
MREQPHDAGHRAGNIDLLRAQEGNRAETHTARGLRRERGTEIRGRREHDADEVARRERVPRQDGAQQPFGRIAPAGAAHEFGAPVLAVRRRGGRGVRQERAPSVMEPNRTPGRCRPQIGRAHV